MTTMHCSICKNHYERQSADRKQHEKVPFHRFPREPKLCSSWVKSIQKFIPDFKFPGDGANICAQHFKKDDYYFSPYFNVARLREDAVPSVFPPIKVPFAPKAVSQPRPILPKPTLVSLDDSVDIKDVYLTKQKKFEVGDKVFCQVGGNLVPGFVENVKCVNVSSTKTSETTNPEFIDIDQYNLEGLTVKSEVSDTEENNFELQEDEVAIENEVVSYSEYNLDTNDIPEYEIKPTILKLNTKRIVVPVPEKYLIPITESKMKMVEETSQSSDSSDISECVIKRVQVMIPKKYKDPPTKTRNEVVKSSQCVDLDMSDIPEYENQSCGKRKMHQFPLIEAPKIKVVKNVHCNSRSQIRILRKRPDDTVQIQNSLKPSTVSPEVPSISVDSTPKVTYSILPPPEKNWMAGLSQPLTKSPSVQTSLSQPLVPSNVTLSQQPSVPLSVQPQIIPSPTCPTFIMLAPQVVTSQSSQLNITSNQLTSAGNAPFIILNPPIMSSQVSVPCSLPSTSTSTSQTTAPPVLTTSSFIPPGVSAAFIQNLLPQFGIPTSFVPPQSTALSTPQTSSSTQTATTFVTTSPVFSYPTPQETIQSSFPQFGMPTSGVSHLLTTLSTPRTSSSTQSTAPTFTTSYSTPQETIQSSSPEFDMPTSCVPPQSIASSTPQTSSSTQSTASTFATTSSVFSYPTPRKPIKSSFPQLGKQTASDAYKAASSTTQNPSSNEQTAAKSNKSTEKPDKSNGSITASQHDDDLVDDNNSMSFEQNESVLESNEGVSDDDDASVVPTDKRTAAVLLKLRKILRERKNSMRGLRTKLQRREKNIKVLTDKLATFTSLSKPTSEHYAAEILSKAFPTCIQHFMSRIAAISDITSKKAANYSPELKDFLVKLRFSNDPYSYLNSMLKNKLPDDEVLNEWAKSSGSIL